MEMRQHESPSTAASTPRPTVEWNNLPVFIATGFWAGRIPWAPGTWGALWGLPLAWAIHLIPLVWAQIAVIVVLCLVGIPICTAAVRRFGGVKDPGDRAR